MASCPCDGWHPSYFEIMALPEQPEMKKSKSIEFTEENEDINTYFLAMDIAEVSFLQKVK